MKALLKIFLPKPATLADMAASKVADLANRNSDKMMLVAQYEEYVKKAAEVQTQLADWIKDGRIDNMEEKEIAELLKSLFDKLYGLL